jgi:hypothetical protein
MDFHYGHVVPVGMIDPVIFGHANDLGPVGADSEAESSRGRLSNVHIRYKINERLRSRDPLNEHQKASATGPGAGNRRRGVGVNEHD